MPDIQSYRGRLAGQWLVFRPRVGLRMTFLVTFVAAVICWANSYERLFIERFDFQLLASTRISEPAVDGISVSGVRGWPLTWNSR